MSALTLRAILVAILVATIAVKVRAAVIPLIDVPAATSRTLAQYGFRPDSSTDTRSLMSFSNPGCRLPLKIGTVTLYLGDGITANEGRKPDYVRRFVYIDREWPSPDRFAMRKEWLKHRISALLGFSPYVPMPVALAIAVPVDCRAADAIDWSRIWTEETAGEIGSGIEVGDASN